MLVTSSVTSQVAGYGPIMVATAGLITALVAGATRRDKASEGRATTLDAKADTALRGLETALDRTEQERARWETRALTAEQRNVECEQKIDALQETLARLSHSDPRPQGPRRKEK